MPPSIQGSKAFWKVRWLQLGAVIQHLGVPTYFLTLTANDNWPELRWLTEDQPAIRHPYESTICFLNRFTMLSEWLWGRHCIFGKVDAHWYRLEFQHRGSLHVHILLWAAKDAKPPSEVICATVPTAEEDDELRELVLTYQIHQCSERCWKPGTETCRYGFPDALRPQDTLNEAGDRYLYRRLKEEDRRVSPYARELLALWVGNMNLQCVTVGGMVRYLTKYVAKMEPSYRLTLQRSLQEDAVASYFRCRVLGAPEVMTYLLSIHLTQCTRSVVFINTEQHPLRMLKTQQELAAMKPDDTGTLALHLFFCLVVC